MALFIDHQLLWSRKLFTKCLFTSLAVRMHKGFDLQRKELPDKRPPVLLCTSWACSVCCHDSSSSTITDLCLSASPFSFASLRPERSTPRARTHINSQAASQRYHTATAATAATGLVFLKRARLVVRQILERRVRKRGRKREREIRKCMSGWWMEEKE